MNISAQEIYNFEAIPYGEEVLIYGAGGAGAQLLEKIKRNRPDFMFLLMWTHTGKEAVIVERK